MEMTQAVASIAQTSDGRVAITQSLLIHASIANYADQELLCIAIKPFRKEPLFTDGEIGIVSGFAFSIFFLVAFLVMPRWVDHGTRRLNARRWIKAHA